MIFQQIQELKNSYNLEIDSSTVSLLYRSNTFNKYLNDNNLFITSNSIFKYCIFMSKWFYAIEAYYDEYDTLVFWYKTRKL